MEVRWHGMPSGSQRGVALVIALILLFTLSVLVVTSVSTASSELVMAGNEQYLANAANAAETGIEQAMVKLDSVSGSLGDDRYEAVIRAVAQESGLPQSSVEKFRGSHYEIESTGRALRGAVDVQLQGVMVVEAAGRTQTFMPLGEGIAP